ncbi:MAG: glycoside hydrolase superfamily [Monoraphidium minutum]|nr:MAG: glycoside hydrolase superfamily [Monoraphidium minutum]
MGLIAFLAMALLALAPLAARAAAAGRRLVDEDRLAASRPPPPPRGAPPPPIRGSASVDLDGWGKDVPPDFLGISHEWTGVEELADPEFLQLFQDLAAYGTGPLVLRVGGGSTDQQLEVPAAHVWEALRAVNRKIGATFILGINFESGDAGLTRRQLEAVRRELPHEAVAAVELGNEPNFYKRKLGMPSSKYLACCYVNDWHDSAVALSCPAGGDAYEGASGAACWGRQLAGPAWGHVHMHPGTLDWFLRVNAKWVGVATVHWYKDTAETPNTAASLLDEGRMRRDAASLAALVETAGRHQKGLRVAEMNTISNSGRRGVSDTLGGALWTLDAALEAAAAGATGTNFHWGAGQTTYTAVIRRTADGKPPMVKPAFYAYLLLQMALSTGSRILPDCRVALEAGRPGALKVWPLVRAADGGARAVLINKHATAAASLRLAFNRGALGGAKLLRLDAPAGGLWAAGDVRIANMSYGWEGIKMFGTPYAELLQPELDAGGNSVYTIALPPASAALFIAGGPK